MNKLLTVLLLMVNLQAFCCDHCNVYINATPNDNKHTLGIYYRSRMMMGAYNPFGLQTMTKHASHGNDPAFWGNTVTEHYRTAELRGRFQIGNRWRTYLIIPFVFNDQWINNDQLFKIGGLGDPMVIQSIQLIDPTKPGKNEDIVHRLELGAGIKFPLGQTKKRINELEPNLDLQSGTGSWDALAMLRYIFKFKEFGIIQQSTYKVNGKNEDDYRYGNTLNASLNLFYQTKVKSFTFMPMMGCSVEHASHDTSFKEHQDTGGSITYVNAGLQLFWKGFQLFGEYQKAVKNQMNGFTQLITKHQINTGLIYNF